MTEQLMFYIIASIVLISALAVVIIKDVVRAVFLFFVTLFSMAGLFVFALADFVAITQIVVYVGGVLVLMIFAFLLSDRNMLMLNLEKKNARPGFHKIAGTLVAILFFLIMIVAFLEIDLNNILWLSGSKSSALLGSDNTLHYIGVNLMTRYLIPFEAVSVLLLMVLIGAVHMARKEKKI